MGYGGQNTFDKETGYNIMEKIFGLLYEGVGPKKNPAHIRGHPTKDKAGTSSKETSVSYFNKNMAQIVELMKNFVDGFKEIPVEDSFDSGIAVCPHCYRRDFLWDFEITDTVHYPLSWSFGQGINWYGPENVKLTPDPGSRAPAYAKPWRTLVRVRCNNVTTCLDCFTTSYEHVSSCPNCGNSDLRRGVNNPDSEAGSLIQTGCGQESYLLTNTKPKKVSQLTVGARTGWGSPSNCGFMAGQYDRNAEVPIPGPLRSSPNQTFTTQGTPLQYRYISKPNLFPQGGYTNDLADGLKRLPTCRVMYADQSGRYQGKAQSYPITPARMAYHSIPIYFCQSRVSQRCTRCGRTGLGKDVRECPNCGDWILVSDYCDTVLYGTQVCSECGAVGEPDVISRNQQVGMAGMHGRNNSQPDLRKIVSNQPLMRLEVAQLPSGQMVRGYAPDQRAMPYGGFGGMPAPVWRIRMMVDETMPETKRMLNQAMIYSLRPIPVNPPEPYQNPDVLGGAECPNEIDVGAATVTDNPGVVESITDEILAQLVAQWIVRDGADGTLERDAYNGCIADQLFTETELQGYITDWCRSHEDQLSVSGEPIDVDEFLTDRINKFLTGRVASWVKYNLYLCAQKAGYTTVNGSGFCYVVNEDHARAANKDLKSGRWLPSRYLCGNCKRQVGEEPEPVGLDGPVNPPSRVGEACPVTRYRVKGDRGEMYACTGTLEEIVGTWTVKHYGRTDPRWLTSGDQKVIFTDPDGNEEVKTAKAITMNWEHYDGTQIKMMSATGVNPPRFHGVSRPSGAKNQVDETEGVVFIPYKCHTCESAFNKGSIILARVSMGALKLTNQWDGKLGSSTDPRMWDVTDFAINTSDYVQYQEGCGIPLDFMVREYLFERSGVNTEFGMSYTPPDSVWGPAKPIMWGIPDDGIPNDGKLNLSEAGFRSI